MLYSVCHAANVHLHYLRQINVQAKGITLEKRKMRYVVYALKKNANIFSCSMKERMKMPMNLILCTRQYSISKAGLFAKTLVGLVHVDDMLTSFVKFKKILLPLENS